MSRLAVLCAGTVIGSKDSSPWLRIKVGVNVIGTSGRKFSKRSSDLNPSPAKKVANFSCIVTSVEAPLATSARRTPAIRGDPTSGDDAVRLRTASGTAPSFPSLRACAEASTDRATTTTNTKSNLSLCDKYITHSFLQRSQQRFRSATQKVRR